MPYISSTAREGLEEPLENLIEELQGNLVDRAGDINYVITRILDSFDPSRYIEFCIIAGILDNASDEFYRRKTSKYENEKCSLHGDVYHN